MLLGAYVKNVLILIALIWSCYSQAMVHNCFPKNNIKNPIGIKSINGLTQEEFKSSIELAKSVYAPIFKEKYQAELVVEEKWEDSTVNAYASQSGRRWKVAMFGGLARDPLVTKDGFTAVICHEMGHHIAGAPKGVSVIGPGWASNEGQSDYFATTKCLRKIYEKEIEETLLVYSNKELTEDQKIAKKACDEVYQNEADAAVCFRSALAGESLAKLLGKLGGNPDVKFGTPDLNVVAKTSHTHPKGQCRMDTYFQGALCDVSHEDWPSMSDASQGYCSAKTAHKVGLRPLCWFNPKEYGL
jgi:hypothetical protein